MLSVNWESFSVVGVDGLQEAGAKGLLFRVKDQVGMAAIMNGKSKQ
jgi:hypothetical protein